MTIIFDTETTGKADFAKPPEDPCQPKLVQLGAQLLGQELEVVGEMNFIIKPVGFEIPQEAANVHGITTQRALSFGSDEKSVLELFACWIEKAKTIVAHNITFDAIVIGNAFHRHGMKIVPPSPYCTMKAATDLCKIPGFRTGEYKWPTLQEAHTILLGEGFDGAHDAMADVRACARVYAHLIHGDRPKKANFSTTPNPKEYQVPPHEYNDNTPMPFGKHRGTPLGKLPDDYVQWLYDQEKLSDARLTKWLHGK
ncbi:MAG: DUF3820 family protein [Patescibacteria group bacterium]|nr:DUF3820 family protein [Patescibacteria group bacterium]